MHLEVNGTVYEVGPPLAEDTHLLVNVRSGLALHRVRLTRELQIEPLEQCQAVAPTEDDTEALYRRALDAAGQGMWADAFGLVSRCLDIEPNWRPYHELYFRCCDALPRPRLAVDAWHRMAEQFPGHEPNRAVLPHLLDIGDVDTARTVLTGTALPGRGEFEAQVAAETEAQAAARPALEAAWQAVQADDDMRALRLLESAWRRAPRMPWLGFNLALACWRTGRIHDAWALLGPTLHRVPSSFLALWGLHSACLSIDVGWLPNALSLLRPLPRAVPRLVWKDDGRERFETTVGPVRERLFELASAASRRGQPVSRAVAGVFDTYRIPFGPPQYAAEMQIEDRLAPSTYQVRSVATGIRYMARVVEALEQEVRLPDHPGLRHVLFRRDTMLFVQWMTRGTLSDWMASGRLYRMDSMKVGLQMAQALHAAHEAGCVHGRLHPGKVYMTAGGEPRIAFDLALTVEQRFLKLMGGPDPRPTDARFSTGLAGVKGDIASWALCLLAIHVGEVPWQSLADVAAGLPHLPGPLRDVVEGALAGRWDTLEEPLQMLGGPVPFEPMPPCDVGATLEEAARLQAAGQPAAALDRLLLAMRDLSRQILAGDAGPVPLCANTHRHAADLAVVLGQTQEARRWALNGVRLWRTVAEHAPEQAAGPLAQALLTLSRTLRGEHPDLAIHAVTEAQSLSDDELVSLELMQCLQAAGRIEEAIECGRQSVSKSSGHVAGLLWSHLGQCLHAAGQAAEALQACRNALACWEGEETPQARLQSALALQLEGDVLMAGHELRQALERYEAAVARLDGLDSLPAAQACRRRLHTLRALLQAQG